MARGLVARGRSRWRVARGLCRVACVVWRGVAGSRWPMAWSLRRPPHVTPVTGRRPTRRHVTTVTPADGGGAGV